MNKYKYQGDWKNGFMDGKGTIEYKNCDKYEGFVKRRIKEGYGILKYNSGDVHIGLW